MKLRYVVVLAALVLAGCKSEGKTTDIAVLIKSLANPYWKTFHDGLTDTAAALGKDAYIQGLENESAAEAQMNQCENALLRKPKVLLFAPVNSVNLVPCLQKAYAQGITLVQIDSYDEPTADRGYKVAFAVASNNYDLGRQAAEYLQGRTGKVLIIAGLAGNEASRLRVQGFTEHLPPGLEVVATLAGDWDRLKAANIATDVGTQNPDLAVVYAANDLMALGASEALRTQGRTDITVVGIDGIADAVKAIKEDRMAASIAQLPYLIAKEGMEKAVAYVEEGKHFDVRQYVPVLTLDKAVLDQQNEPLLQYVR